MFTSATEVLDTDSKLKIKLFQSNEQLSYHDVMKFWQESELFRAWFSEQLRALPFAAYRWETPPVTTSSIHQLFEFVVIECDSLERLPDRKAFAKHFTKQTVRKGIAAFPNLGKDAYLIVPTPPTSDQSSDQIYVHLGSFTQGASYEQKDALWKQVGMTLKEQLSSKPLWLSTAGMGVAWLHLRFDTRPKYYSHQPYREMG